MRVFNFFSKLPESPCDEGNLEKKLEINSSFYKEPCEYMFMTSKAKFFVRFLLNQSDQDKYHCMQIKF